jgi:aryl-alcohol dehydrogenase-like predicted oxidoreductase
MNRVILPDGRPTSCVGYGTAALHGGWSKRQSLRLLDAAFDVGISHFDTAPLYGLGQSESIVGEFLARRKSAATVTTKFGLVPPKGASLLNVARVALKPIIRHFPSVKARLVQTIARSNTSTTSTWRYSPEAMRASLETSLRALKCERIDIFLLHEAEVMDVTDELRSALDVEVAKGNIGAWGLGSANIKLRIAAAQRHYKVVQTEWSTRQPILSFSNKFVITHGVLRNDLPWFLQKHPDLNRAAAARMLLSAAVRANPTGISLFTSKSVKHISEVASVEMPTKLADK